MHHLSYTPEELRLRRLARQQSLTPTDEVVQAATKARRTHWLDTLRGLGRNLRRREPTLAPQGRAGSPKG